MAAIEIIYAHNDAMAVKLDNVLYYMSLQDGLPRVYDNTGRQLIIPNVDSWIQAKTRQRYSITSLRDMCAAFQAGMLSSYVKTEVLAVVEYAVKHAIDEIMHRGMIYDYSLLYWIEVQGTDKLESYLKTISNKLDVIVQRVGRQKLINELKRINRVCVLRQSSARYVCEKLLERLNIDSNDPIFPKSDAIDAKVMQNAINEVLKYLKREHKSVDSTVVGVVDGLQTGGLSGAKGTSPPS